jgi:hypothetical protein
MKDAENASHEGKKKYEVLWPIFQISHQRTSFAIAGSANWRHNWRYATGEDNEINAMRYLKQSCWICPQFKIKGGGKRHKNDAQFSLSIATCFLRFFK